MTVLKSPVIFADRIESAGAGGGVIRLNLAIEAPGELPAEGKSLPVEHVAQIIMPINGAAQGVQMLINLLRQLERQARAPEAGPVTETPPPPSDAPIN